MQRLCLCVNQEGGHIEFLQKKTHQETWGQPWTVGFSCTTEPNGCQGFTTTTDTSAVGAADFPTLRIPISLRRSYDQDNQELNQYDRHEEHDTMRQPGDEEKHCYTFAFHNCNSNTDELDINSSTCKYLLSKQRHGDVSQVLFLSKRTLFLQITILSKNVNKSHKHKIIWMSKQTVSSGALSGSRIIQ